MCVEHVFNLGTDAADPLQVIATARTRCRDGCLRGRDAARFGECCARSDVGRAHRCCRRCCRRDAGDGRRVLGDATARQNVRLLDPVLALDPALETQRAADRLDLFAGPHGDLAVARDTRGVEFRFQRSIDGPDAREIVTGRRSGMSGGGRSDRRGRRHRWRNDRWLGRRRRFRHPWRCRLRGRGRCRIGGRVAVGTTKAGLGCTYRRLRPRRNVGFDGRRSNFRAGTSEYQPFTVHAAGPLRFRASQLARQTADDAAREIGQQKNGHRLPGQRDHLQPFPRQSFPQPRRRPVSPAIADGQPHSAIADPGARIPADEHADQECEGSVKDEVVKQVVHQRRLSCAISVISL